jgi:hypothetical protein
MRAPPKVHKRHHRYDKAVCGNPDVLLTNVNAEVTCKACLGWLPLQARKAAAEERKAADRG